MPDITAQKSALVPYTKAAHLLFSYSEWTTLQTKAHGKDEADWDRSQPIDRDSSWAILSEAQTETIGASLPTLIRLAWFEMADGKCTLIAKMSKDLRTLRTSK